LKTRNGRDPHRALDAARVVPHVALLEDVARARDCIWSNNGREEHDRLIFRLREQKGSEVMNGAKRW
jgi:hypothetical protein